jgi:D-alanyl-D-alanine carboxypeptidase
MENKQNSSNQLVNDSLAIACQGILNKAIDNKKIQGVSVAISHNEKKWIGAAGNLSSNQQFFIASSTKLFTSALIFQLCQESKLTLNTPLVDLLQADILKNLNFYQGIDYSSKIQIHHLLSHTSGIPDYFQDKNNKGKSLELELMAGNDRKWSPLEAIEMSKKINPHFIPGTKGKAHYSDTNFQLLGLVIEAITKQRYSECLQERIITPLQLKNTYLYQEEQDLTPAPLYYNSDKLLIPKAMTSFGADGGIVSTAEELLQFIEAFFSGKIFSTPPISELTKWNPIFFPFQAGLGIQRFRLPWFFDPFRSMPEWIGHSGLSGTVAFYAPKQNLYIAGTVNQVAHPDSSFRLMIKLYQALKK